MEIIGLDPGGTTGVCRYTTFDSGSPVIESSQLGPGEHHLELFDLLVGHHPDLIICERFDYRPRQGNADLSPVEYIGIVNMYWQYRDQSVERDVEVFYQQQLAHDKGLWTDDKLKVVGLHTPGKPHANDATRQVLYYVTNHMNDPYWIELYGRLV